MDSDLLNLSAQASLAGREKCQRLMHEDAVDFQKCAGEWIAKLPTKSQSDLYFKLGAAYFAWLSSTSAAKNGMPMAEESALHFLQIFRPLQKRLKVSDETLCPTIEGDCKSRVARMLIMENEVKNSSTQPNSKILSAPSPK